MFRYLNSLMHRHRRRQSQLQTRRRRLLLEELESRRVLAGAVPEVTLNLPDEVFIGEPVNFTATFDNTASPPGNVGYGPFVDLVFNRNGADGMAGTDLPLDGLTFTTATYLGSPLTTTIFTFPNDGGGTGCVRHPYAVNASRNRMQVCGTTGDQLVVLQLPFGSFTPDQPEVTIDITASMSDFADLGVPLDVQTRGGFQFGCDPLNNPSVDPTILTPGSTSVDSSTWAESADVTPIIMTMEKTYLGPEDETATGPNFMQQYELTVNIAPGQTITNLDIIDGFDNNIVVTGISVITSHSPSPINIPVTPFGPANFAFPTDELVATIPSVTGTGSGDVVVLIDFYVSEFDADGMRVIPVNGEDDTLSSITENNSRSVGDWTPLDPRDMGSTDNAVAEPDPINPDHVLDDKSIAIQKSVAVVGGGMSSPGLTLEYTLEFQVSDFYTFGDLVITDTFSDGQDFDFGFTPTLNVTDQDGSVVGTFTLGLDSTHTPNVDFTETVTFDVSAALVNNGAPDGILRGGYATEPDGEDVPPFWPPTRGVAATGTVVFRTTIPDFYDDPPGTRVAQGDSLSNIADIDGSVRDNNAIGTTIGMEDDDTSATVTIPRGEVIKAIYAVNGVIPPPPGFILAPGDEVTYSIRYDHPITSFVDFSLSDFLPLPVFRVDDPDADGVPGPAWSFNVESAGPARDMPPASGVVELGPDDTFFDYRPFGMVPPPNTDVDNPPDFFSPPTLSIDTDANSLSFFYGDFNDPDNMATTIELLFTVTTTDDPMADGLFLTNIVRAFESNTALEASIDDSIVQIPIGQPVLGVTKGVVATDHPSPPAAFNPDPPVSGPLTVTAPGTSGYRFSGTVNSNYLSTMPRPLDSNLSGVDAGDLVTFSIIVENTGSSRTGAFDIRISDTLPAGFAIPGGSPGLNLSVTDGTGAAIGFTDLGGGLFGSGIELADPGPTPAMADGTDGGALDQFDDVNGRNILVITYDLLADTSVVPLQEIDNTAQIDAFAGTEGGTNHVTPGDEPSDDATVTIGTPGVNKIITGTNQPHTTGNNVAIGEIVTYQATITVPEGTTNNALFVDRLDSGLAFVEIVSITASPDVTTDAAGGFAGVAAGVSVNTVGSLPDGGGREFVLDFGNITNANTDDATAETIVVTYRAVVINSTNNNRGNGRNNQADWRWDTDAGTQQVRNSAPNVTIVEPTLQVIKSATPATGEAGDVVTFTIDVSHSGVSNAGAFDVDLEDLIPADTTYVAASVMHTGGLAPAALMFTGTAITASWPTFPLATTSQIQFQVTLDATIVPGATVTNTAAIQWTSLPGDVTTPQSAFNTISTERTGDPADPGGAANDYNDTDPADVLIFDPVPTKALVETSEPTTTGNDLTIGEIARYRLQVELPQGTNGPAFQIVDHLPAGLSLLDLGEIRISFTSDVPMTLPPDLTPANNNAVPPTFVMPAGRIATSGQDVFFDIGSVVNNDVDANSEFVTIEFNALVENTALNNDGDTKNNFFEIMIAGFVDDVSNTVTVDIVEPEIVDVDKQLISSPPTDAGDAVVYRVTYSNTGSTTAFDVRLLDNLNSTQFTNLAVGPIVLGGGATGINDNSAGNTVDVVIDEVPVGGTVSVTYSVDLAIGVQPGQMIDNTADVTFTSLPMNGTPIGPDNMTGSTTPGGPGAADGQRDGSGAVNDHADSNNETIAIVDPGFVKTLTNTNQPHTTGFDVAIGEIVTYQAVITVPEGTMPGATVVDMPDATLAIVDVVSVFPNSGAVTTDVAGGFPAVVANANASIPPDGSSVTIDMGTLTNSDTDNGVTETLTITYRAVVLNDVANSRGFTLDNEAVLTWSQGALTAAGETVTVVEPTLVINKSNGSPLLGQAGDTITFTITVQHAPDSDADAFDVVLSDLIDSVPNNMNYVPGSVMVTSMGGAVLAGPPNESGGDLTIVWSEFPLPASATITFDVVLTIGVMPDEILTNIANVTWSSLPGNVTSPQSSNPVSTERTGNPGDPGGSANDYSRSDAGVVATPTLTAEKAIIDTSDPSTGTSQGNPTVTDLTIGETVTFAIIVDFIDGTTNNVVIRDNLPVPGTLFGLGVLEYVNATLEFVGADLTDGASMPIVLPAPVLNDTNGDGVIDEVILNFGTIVNAPGGSEPDNQMVIGIEARLLDEYPAPPAAPGTQANVDGLLLTNTSTVSYDTGMGSTTLMDTVQVESVEPALTITKDATPTLVSGSETITFTITVDHTLASSADAFDVSITDVIPSGLTYAGNVTPITGPGPAITLALPTVTFSWSDIPLNDGPYQFTFDVTVDPTIMAGDTFVNTADLEWSSLPGPDPNERTYDDSADSPTITSAVEASNPLKSQIATSEPSTGGSDVTIGEIIRYRLEGEFTGGTFANLQLVDTLPAGLVLVDLGEVRVSFIADTPWTLPADIAGAANNAVPPTFVLPPARILNPMGPTTTFDLGTVTNNSVNPGFVVLEYNALVENTADANDGDTFDNAYQMFVGGMQVGDPQTTEVSVLEPSIVDVQKRVVDITATSVTYQINFSNTGTTTAFDTRVTDALPGDVALDLGSISVALGGGASGVTDNSAGNLLDLTIDAIPTGGTVVVAYTANIVVPGTTISNTANVNFTSLPGTGTPTGPDNQTGSTTPGGAGDPNGERDGSGGVNDYSDSDSELLGSLGDFVWYDINGDGMQDFGEPGLSGVNVSLTWAGSNGIFGDGDDVTITMMTDGAGNYSFSGLPAGTYVVEIDTATLPPGLVNTFDLDGNLDSQTTVPLAAGQNRTDVDFGFADAASVDGIKYEDLNGNGLRDFGEPTLAGVTIFADLNNNGIFEPNEPSAVTDALGQYVLSPLTPGMHTIREIPPVGYLQTQPPSPGGYNLTLAPNQSATDLDFGNQPIEPIMIDACFDPGFTILDGDWVCFPECPGHLNDDVSASPPGAPFSRSRWTFTDLDPGFYRVSTTWGAATTNATNARYEVLGGPLTTTITVDQLLDPGAYPNSFVEQGQPWMDLDPVYQILGNTLIVDIINDGADGWVLADAVRIERLANPAIRVFQSGTELEDGISSVDYGSTTSGVPVPRTYTIESVGGTDLNLATPITVPAGFSVTSSFGATTVPPETSTSFDVSLDAVDPGFYAGEISFPNSDPTQNPFNFEVTGLVDAFLIDNGQPGYSRSGGWTTFNGQGFQNDVDFSFSGNGSNVASWTFNGLTPGDTYQVYTTWTSHPNRASNAPYTITGGAMPSTVTVDQTNGPQGETVGGATWQVIDTVTLSGPTLTVSLSNNANGFVIADAVRIDRIPGAEISVTQSGTELLSGVSAVDYGNTFVGASVIKTYTVTNVGIAPLTLTNPPVVPGGFTASNFGTTNLVPGGSTTFTVTLAATTVGSYSGAVALTNSDTDENPFLFDVTGQVFTTLPEFFIDDGDPGFSTVGAWSVFSGQGYQNDLRFSAAGTGTDVATWTVNVPAPGTYRVSATWREHPNRATNAPFSVNGSAPILINQQLPPNDFTELGTAWEDLGNFVIAGTSLTVTLNDNANGFVIADALRIEHISSPEATFDFQKELIKSESGQFDFGDTLVGHPIVETFRVRNIGTETLVLAEPISVPNGFEVQPPTRIGIAPEEHEFITVTLTADSPGDYQGDIVFVTNDPDENFFRLHVRGQVALGSIRRLSDNGDAGFASSGDWTHTTYRGQGFDGDVHFSAAGDGQSVATWTFPSLGRGEYRVAVTWSEHSNRATNAPFSINGSSPQLINQQFAPDDFSADGVSWEVLDHVTVTGNSIVVQLTNAADGFVIADAVRVDLVSDAHLSVEAGGRAVETGDGFLDFGIANQFSPLGRPLTLRNTGGQSLTLTGPITVPAGFSASPFSAVVLAPGESTTVVVTMDADEPGRFGGTVILAESDNNSSAFTFQVAGQVMEPAYVAVLDDGDRGFSTSGAWFPYSGQGAQDDVTFAAAGNGADIATWTFELPSPGLYNIAATWSSHRNRATNAPYWINQHGPILVNQERSPADFTESGIAWHRLGEFEIEGTTLTVTLTNAADEYVIADAIRIQQIVTPTAQVIDNGDAGFGLTGVWNHYIGQGRENDVHFAQAGTGDAAATWTFTVPVAGQYRVSATWSAHPNRADDVPYTITAGNESITVHVNQERSPDDFLAADTAWEDLAVINVADNSLVVRLTNAANAYVIADAIRVEYVGPPHAPAPIFQVNSLPQPTYSAANAWQNPRDRYDVDDNGWAQALDVLILVNEINSRNFTQPDRQLPPARPADFRLPYLDITGDNAVTALDVIALINRLNNPALAKTDYEDSRPAALHEKDVDEFFGTFNPYFSS